jgi:1,4-dihydroxy-2-naphthoate octaprenyltransferase
LGLLDLYRARSEGRFTLKHWVEAWIISTRFFALPWAMLNCLFGAALAGLSDWQTALAASAVVGLVLLAAHFRNNYRDVELGVDRYVDSVEEARRTISTIKPYTAAAWLVPLRITSVRFQKVNEYASLALATLLYALYVFPRVPLTLPVFLLGVFLAESYADFWKRAGLGDVAIFMGHGYSSTLFGYLSQGVAGPAALLVGLVPGLASGLMYPIDQYLDISTGSGQRSGSRIAVALLRSGIPLSAYVVLAYSAFAAAVYALVEIGAYPRGVLVVLATLPLVVASAVRLKRNPEKAIRDMVATLVFLVPLLMFTGVLFRQRVEELMGLLLGLLARLPRP